VGIQVVDSNVVDDVETETEDGHEKQEVEKEVEFTVGIPARCVSRKRRKKGVS
jgi:hypothetical protein